nr:MAG TPA: hypothetical protein [Caudoviricetes sp.]
MRGKESRVIMARKGGERYVTVPSKMDGFS